MKLLEVSSFFFLTNVVHNAYYKQYTYSWLFLLLTTTSIFIHSEFFKDSLNLHTKIIVLDKIIIICIFFYGFYLHLKNISILPIISILFVIHIYSNIYNIEDSVEFIHSIMHLIGSFGHHSIIYNYSIFLKQQNIE
jgi:hypothetical protein